ncbi:SirB2 family protein [Wielerella bovis]|uniref:SirB2 family protein n=1 Tax=Wielerella bovis TaxID=2917790 RepID=UPI00201892AD|nr:SirB2 family protein [Wielerella bovis]ULJ59569.1 SirB2 family protein [Wielerella bovis]
MGALYLPVKHFHLLFVVSTLVLFNLRFWLRTRQPEKTLPKVLKILPHINDSMLLFSGMLMMHIIPWQPFGAHKWLGIKLLLVVAYIVMGVICLRAQPRSTKWWGAYALAMLIVAVIVYLARWKPI